MYFFRLLGFFVAFFRIIMSYSNIITDQQTIKPPTTIDNVLAALLSFNKRNCSLYRFVACADAVLFKGLFLN